MLTMKGNLYKYLRYAWLTYKQKEYLGSQTYFPRIILLIDHICDQGPFGMQLISSAPSSEELFTHTVTDYIYTTTGYSETNALSLEASIQRSVEEELYSSLEVCSSCNEYTQFLIRVKFFVSVSRITSVPCFFGNPNTSYVIFNVC